MLIDYGVRILCLAWHGICCCDSENNETPRNVPGVNHSRLLSPRVAQRRDQPQQVTHQRTNTMGFVGELCFAGGTDWQNVGRTKSKDPEVSEKGRCLSFSLSRSLLRKDIEIPGFVAWPNRRTPPPSSSRVVFNTLFPCLRRSRRSTRTSKA